MLGDPYATLAELKAYVGIPLTETLKDEQLGWALDSASREIEDCCERQFNKATTVSQRIFELATHGYVEVDDFYTTTGLIVEYALSSTADTWTALTQYQLSPLNGVVNGVPGWPYSSIERDYTSYFPYCGFVRVTASWGWDSVPEPVHQACLMMAARNYKMASAPLGLAGMDEFGVARVRDFPDIYKKLKRYKRIGVNVG